MNDEIHEIYGEYHKYEGRANCDHVNADHQSLDGMQLGVDLYSSA